ncbi:MAG TPA: glycine zipper 2TM domain-containing protein [Burkholderiales bacterium]
MRPAIAVAALAALLAGCQTRESANVYGKHETGREQTVRFATVDAVRKVTIQGSQSGLGGVAGGVVGGVAGSGVGEGRGSTVGAVLGGVAGGVAGNTIENRMTEKAGLEITVRLESGELRAIVQEADLEFMPGQRVRLVTSGGITRVTPN